MLPPTQRVHYFDHQFLRVEDFTDEQAYHLQMRRAHNRMLHTPGVAHGLALTFSGPTVTVSPGMALDAAGREIVLAAAAEVQVPSELAGKTAWLTIAWEERTTDATTETGAAGDRRWEEVPALRLTATVPSDPGTRLVLGRVTSDASRAVVKVDDGTATTSRRVAGPAPGAALEVRSLAVAANAEVAGTLAVAGAVGMGTAPAAGALLSVGAALKVAETAVGIGTAPAAGVALAVGGVLDATELRQKGAAVVSSQWGAVAAGISYAGGKVGIGVAAPGSLLDVNERMRLRGEGASTSSAGLWLYQRGVNADLAFIGMNGDDVVGVNGAAGAGWGLNMGVATGNVGIRTAPAAAGGAALTVAGSVSVSGAASVTGGLTAGGASGLVVTTGGRVGIGTSPAGGGGPALTVSGDGEVSGSLTVKGTALTVDAGNVRSKNVITLHPNTDSIGDTGVKVMHPGGTELLALDGSGNLRVNGRVWDARVRNEVKRTNFISRVNAGTATDWALIEDMSMSVVSPAADTWFLIRFYMGGVEARETTRVEVRFRLVIGTTEEALTVETFNTTEWSARGVEVERLIKLGAGTHTVKAEWKLMQAAPARIAGCHLSSMRTLKVIEL